MKSSANYSGRKLLKMKISDDSNLITLKAVRMNVSLPTYPYEYSLVISLQTIDY